MSHALDVVLDEAHALALWVRAGSRVALIEDEQRIEFGVGKPFKTDAERERWEAKEAGGREGRDETHDVHVLVESSAGGG